jgi:hypothetical protein
MLWSVVWLYRQAATVVASHIHGKCKKIYHTVCSNRSGEQEIGKSRINITFLGMYWMGSEKKVMRYFA